MTRARGDGFTLVEVIVAIGVLVIALLGLASGISSGMALDALTRERSAATLAAVSRVEEALASPFDQLPGRDGTTFDVTLEAEGGSYRLTPGGGRSSAGLVRVLPTDRSDCLRVEVTVVFRSQGTHSDARVRLDTLVARR